MFILRYTENAKNDLEKGYSYHQIQNLSVYEGLEKWVERKGEYVDLYEGLTALEIAEVELGFEVEEINGFLLQPLEGLCGFELDADNLFEAIEIAKSFYYNGTYNTAAMPEFAIFEGDFIDTNEEGLLFNPIKILYSQNQK